MELMKDGAFTVPSFLFVAKKSFSMLLVDGCDKIPSES